MSYMGALYSASQDVLATQCQQLSIQRRYQVDMHDLWMMQAKLERRTGKNPFAVINHPRYRAAYDFLLLRSLVGETEPELVTWWETFAEASEDERHEMIEAAQREARQSAASQRKKDSADTQGGSSERTTSASKRRRRPRRRSSRSKAESAE